MGSGIVVVSGGQTGVDRAALDAARTLGVAYGGWLPKGRLAEDGVLGAEYVGMREMPTENYIKRTRQNVIDSDMTVVICHGEPEGGTRRTIDFCRNYGKPYLAVNLDQEGGVIRATIVDFVRRTEGRRINFAGPRTSRQPAVYDEAKKLIEDVLRRLESRAAEG